MGERRIKKWSTTPILYVLAVWKEKAAAGVFCGFHWLLRPILLSLIGLVLLLVTNNQTGRPPDRRDHFTRLLSTTLFKRSATLQSKEEETYHQQEETSFIFILSIYSSIHLFTFLTLLVYSGRIIKQHSRRMAAVRPSIPRRRIIRVPSSSSPPPLDAACIAHYARKWSSCYSLLSQEVFLIIF